MLSYSQHNYLLSYLPVIEKSQEKSNKTRERTHTQKQMKNECLCDATQKRKTAAARRRRIKHTNTLAKNAAFTKWKLKKHVILSFRECNICILCIKSYILQLFRVLSYEYKFNINFCGGLLKQTKKYEMKNKYGWGTDHYKETTDKKQSRTKS